MAAAAAVEAASVSFVIRGLRDIYKEHGYKIYQERGEEEEIYMEREKPQQVPEGSKLFRVVFTGELWLKRQQPPTIEILNYMTRQVVYMRQEDIQRPDVSTSISEILSHNLGLPQQQCPALIYKLIDAARSFSSLPENSGLVEIPIKFRAGIIISLL